MTRKKRERGKVEKGRQSEGKRMESVLGRGLKGSLGRGSVFRSVGKKFEGVLGRGLEERRSDKRRIEE